MRKHFSEHAVSLFSARWLLLPSQQLMSEGTMSADEALVAENCHIYLICKHPAANFVPDGFGYNDGHLFGNVVYRVRGIEHNLPFRFPFPLLDGAVEVRLSQYPHREIKTFDADGRDVRYVTASSILLGFYERLQHENLGKFEVLYVGQAYAQGKRSAFDRLRSHSTLQKILAEAHYSDPDSEVYVFAFEYAPYRLMTQIVGMANSPESIDEDGERFISILESPLTQHQQICLVEAALIRYFAPPFNEIYRENFPSESHKILQQCYQLDIGGLVVEINTDDLQFSLFSARVAPAVHHVAKIDLFDKKQRLGFFHMSDGKGGFFEQPDVIARR
jgi:hypothetical protein